MIAAGIGPVTADISSDDSILNCWVSIRYPQCDMSAAAICCNTCLWDMSAQAINEETIPAAPGDIGVTLVIFMHVMCIIGGSPWFIQHSVVVAGVRQICCNENILKN